jgi:hypothetical protein
MARDAKQYTVDEIFSAGKLRIPDSQRKFEWGYEDAAELVDDLIASAKTSKPEDQGIYLGTIIALHNQRTKTEPSIFDIYDGQQRLTTITILFLAVRVLASQRDNKKFSSAIHRSFISYEDTVGRDRGWRFEASPTVRKPLEHAFSDEWMGEKIILDGLGAHWAVKRFQTVFEGLYSSLSKLTDHQLENFAAELSKAEFTFISITETQEAYDLFERTNARGRPLDVSDLLKNQLFKNQRFIENLNERWGKVAEQSGSGITKMLRYFYMAKNGHVKKSETYKKLLPLINKGPNEFLVELEWFASFFHFMSSKDADDFEVWAGQNGLEGICDDQVRVAAYARSLKAIKFFGITQVLPILFAGFDRLRGLQGKDQKKDNKVFLSILEVLESFHAAYSLVGKLPGNKVEYVYARLATQLAKGKNMNEVRTLVLRDVYKPLRPTEEEFAADLQQVSYKNSSADKILYLFDRLYNSSHGSLDREDLFDPGKSLGKNKLHTVEHIYPQSPNEGSDDLKLRDSSNESAVFIAVHSLGNLTVLNRDDNGGAKGVGNMAPNEKFAFLADRGKHNPRYVVDFLDDIEANSSGKWDIDAINSRTRRISSALYNKAFSVQV